MERYKNFVRIEEMKNLLLEGKQKEALAIAQSIDLRKMKNISELNTVADVFWQNNELQKARECMLKIYDRTKTRRVLMQLINISVKMKNPKDAEKYYEEFLILAPDDFYRYIFRYNIDKLLGKTYEELIPSLEALKKIEYIDKWAYELAKLYHKAGMQNKCIDECNDIVIWFGSGDIVDRAKALRAYYLGELDIETVVPAKKTQEEDAEPVSAVEDTEASSPEYEHSVADHENTKEVSAYSDDEELSPEEEKELEELSRRIVAESELQLMSELKRMDLEGMINDENAANAAHSWSHEYEGDDKQAVASAEAEQPDVIEYTGYVPQVSESAEAEGEAAAEYAQTDAEGDDKQTAQEASEVDDEDAADKVENAQVTAEEVDSEAETEEIADKAEYVQTAAEKADTAEFAQSNGKEVNEENEEPKETEMLSERELAEREVEEALVSMLEEENELAKRREFGSSGSELVDYKIAFAGRNLPEPESFFGSFLKENNAVPEDYFGWCVFVDSLRSQLYKCMELLLNPQIKNISLVVSGTEGSGKSTVIRGIARVLNQQGYLKEKKIATLTGDKLNHMNLADQKTKLQGCCLIIEKAGGLDSAGASQLYGLRDTFGRQTVIAMEDTRSEINKLFREYGDLNGEFPNRIHLQRYNSQELYMLSLWELHKKNAAISEDAARVLKEQIRNKTSRLENGELKIVMQMVYAARKHMEMRTAQIMLECAAAGKPFESSQVYIKPEDIV